MSDEKASSPKWHGTPSPPSEEKAPTIGAKKITPLKQSFRPGRLAGSTSAGEYVTEHHTRRWKK